MTKIFSYTTQTVLMVAVVDVAVLFTMMVGVMMALPVQHIPFWDVQLRFILGLIVH